MNTPRDQRSVAAHVAQQNASGLIWQSVAREPTNLRGHLLDDLDPVWSMLWRQQSSAIERRLERVDNLDDFLRHLVSLGDPVDRGVRSHRCGANHGHRRRNQVKCDEQVMDDAVHIPATAIIPQAHWNFARDFDYDASTGARVAQPG